MIRDLSWSFLSHLAGPKLRIMVSGGHGHVPKSENYESYDFSGFPKIKQNNSTELSGHSFLEIYNKNGFPDPPDPKSGFVLDFPGFSLGSQKGRDRIYMFFSLCL